MLFENIKAKNIVLKNRADDSETKLNFSRNNLTFYLL